MWGTVSRKLKSERCHLGLDQCFIRLGLGVTCSTTRRHLHRSEVCPKSPFPWAWVVTLSSVLYTRGIASTDVFVRVLQTEWGRCVGEARRCDQGAGAGGRWSQSLRQGQRGQRQSGPEAPGEAPRAGRGAEARTVAEEAHEAGRRHVPGRGPPGPPFRSLHRARRALVA